MINDFKNSHKNHKADKSMKNDHKNVNYATVPES